jgi:hypothetical protein
MLAGVGSGRRLIRKALRRPMRLPMIWDDEGNLEGAVSRLLVDAEDFCLHVFGFVGEQGFELCVAHHLCVVFQWASALRRLYAGGVSVRYSSYTQVSEIGLLAPGMGDFGRFDVRALDEPDRYARFGESLPVRRAAPEIALNRRHHRRTGACKHQHGNCDVVSLLATPIADSASSAPSAPSASTGY